MIATRADLRLALTALRNGTTLSGGLTGDVLRDITFFDGLLGDGARAVNRMLYREDLDVVFGAPVSFDLDTESAPPDASLGLVDGAVRLFYARAKLTNTQDLLVDFTVATPWNTIFTGTHRLKPGAELLWVNGGVAANVAAANKNFAVAAQVAGTQVLEKLLVLGATLA